MGLRLNLIAETLQRTVNYLLVYNVPQPIVTWIQVPIESQWVSETFQLKKITVPSRDNCMSNTVGQCGTPYSDLQSTAPYRKTKLGMTPVSLSN